MAYGAGEQHTPNGERAVCYYCREQIHSHMEENTPMALCGRGDGVTERAEWKALLKLAREIGSGAKTIKGWTPGTMPYKVPTRQKAASFFGLGASLEHREDGTLVPKLTTAEQNLIKKGELRRSLLLVDKIQVQRAKISESKTLKASAKK
jgi:hypothetical protein